MKYKIEKSSELGEKLSALFEKAKAIRAVTHDFTEKLGFNEYFISSEYAAGGIAAFGSKTQPEGYRKLPKGGYFPKAIKANKELLKQISELPKLSRYEFAKVLKFEFQIVGMAIVSCPGIIPLDDCYLVTVHDECDYKPIDGMTEILGSEYLRLQGK